MVKTILAFLMLGSAMGRADPHNPAVVHSDSEPYSRLALTVGLLTPTGELGFEYTFVRRYFEVGTGVGAGLLGAQASIMPRLRLDDRGTVFTLGAGISGGPRHEKAWLCLTTDYDKCRATDATVFWANIELGIELTSRSGATLRFYGGAGELFAHADCTGPRCEGLDTERLPYFGIALGFTF